MRHLVNIVNEAMIPQPAVEGKDTVKVLALASGEHVDDNLNLMKGMNRVCLVWSPEDCKGYVCANGGVKWDDGKHWSTLKNLDNVIGKFNWKKVDKINVDYSYRGQIGDRGGYDIDVFAADVPLKDLMRVYRQNGMTLWIYKRGYSTATLKEIFADWRDKGLLS